jgi:hypothetical protein
MYGAKSPSRYRYAAKYAVPARCGLGSIAWIRPPGGRSRGVTLVHDFPSSRVTCTGPSFDPAQITPF